VYAGTADVRHMHKATWHDGTVMGKRKISRMKRNWREEREVEEHEKEIWVMMMM